MITLNYVVENHGWAYIDIGNGKSIERISISYLHNSLKQLAESAIRIRLKDSANTSFFKEPGEAQLRLSKINDKTLNFDLRLYHKLVSWNECSEGDFQIILKGQCSVINYINEVRNALTKIHNEIGPALYKEKWIKHDFPTDEYNLLK